MDDLLKKAMMGVDNEEIVEDGVLMRGTVFEQFE
jgi:hypothetical protein